MTVQTALAITRLRIADGLLASHEVVARRLGQHTETRMFRLLNRSVDRAYRNLSLPDHFRDPQEES